MVSLADLDDHDSEVFESAEPPPELAAQLAEELQRRLDSLNDESLRRVALGKLDGCTNREIASRLGCVEKTIERKLRSIRKLWSDSEEASP